MKEEFPVRETGKDFHFVTRKPLLWRVETPLDGEECAVPRSAGRTIFMERN